MPGRKVAVILLAVTAPLLLAGCTKPLPTVALYGNGQTVRTEPSVFCFPGQSFQDNECVTQRLDAPRLQMEWLDRVSVDVPAEIAHDGYLVEVGGRNAGGIQTTTYFSVPLALQENQETNVRVVALSEPSATASVTGVWQFVLQSGT